MTAMHKMQQKHRLPGKTNHCWETKTTKTANTKASSPNQKSKNVKHCEVNNYLSSNTITISKLIKLMPRIL